eukprot:3799637-Rhodomonas_salina.2
MLLVHPPTPFAVRIRADAPGTDSGWGGRRLKRSTLKPAAAKARESGKVSLLLFDDPLANPYARCTFSWVWIRGSRASIGVCMARSRASGGSGGCAADVIARRRRRAVVGGRRRLAEARPHAPPPLLRREPRVRPELQVSSPLPAPRSPSSTSEGGSDAARRGRGLVNSGMTSPVTPLVAPSPMTPAIPGPLSLLSPPHPLPIPH